ncbi:MAG: hypothetical protein VB858_03165 [Planctomycetaceae bacterium]
MFQQVPKLETISNSIELTFSAPPDGYVPGFKTPLSKSGPMGAHFLRLVLDRHPILPPQIDVVWRVDGLPDDVSLLTEKPCGADDILRLVPPDSDPAALCRGSRRNGTWIPEKLIGHVRRP